MQKQQQQELVLYVLIATHRCASPPRRRHACPWLLVRAQAGNATYCATLESLLAASDYVMLACQWSIILLSNQESARGH